MHVPLFAPEFGAEEEAALIEVLRSGWVSMGPRVEQLEQAFCDYLDVPHAVAVNSGTAALHLAALLLDLGPGDEVIVPSLTFAATVNCIHYTGATPVFADVRSEDDWTIDPEDVLRRITPRTRAVVVMHYGGYPCDMRALSALCREHDLALIEDACHGLGGSVEGRALGTISDLGCFSFYSNKVMTTAEGGLLVTTRPEHAQRARLLRSHGMTALAIDRERGVLGYDIEQVGYNYRLDELRAALGLAQLARLPGWMAARRSLVSRYAERLAEIPGLRLPRHGCRGEPAHYILPVLLESADRDRLRKALDGVGVQTSIHYPPVHRFSHYRRQASSLPVTENLASRILTLPLFPSLTLDQLDYVCDQLVHCLETCGRTSATGH